MHSASFAPHHIFKQWLKLLRVAWDTLPLYELCMTHVRSQSGTRPVSEASLSHRTAKSPQRPFRGRASVLELCASWIFKTKSPTKCVQVRVNGPWSLFNRPCPQCPKPDALKAASGGTIQDKSSITFSCQVWAVTFADSINHLVTDLALRAEPGFHKGHILLPLAIELRINCRSGVRYDGVSSAALGATLSVSKHFCR